MKSIIILLAIISACYGGHIYVGDISLQYQNEEAYRGAVFSFMLESGISSSDYLKITWPFDFTSASVDSDSFFQTVDGTKIEIAYSHASTNKVVLSPASALAANQWYQLTLMLSATPTAKLYKDPVKLQTISQDTADAVIYDENPSAGLLTIVPAAVTIADIQVSTDATLQKDVSNTTSNKNLGAAPYTVFIDVLPLGDYHKGGLIYYMLEAGQEFTFGSTCTVVDNNCPLATADATCRNATKAGGSCTLDGTDTTKKTLKASFNSLYKAQSDTIKTYYRISATVQNPVFFDSTGSKLKVSIESKNVYRKYEKGETSAIIFTLNQIAITDKKYTIFWGLVPDSAAAVAQSGEMYGCPIAIYKNKATPKLFVYNKLTVYFAVGTAFPTSTNVQYELVMKISSNAVMPIIAFPSVASNMQVLPSGSKITCLGDGTNTTQIYCSNVGALTATTYWLAFSVAFPNDIAAGDIAALGAVKFNQYKGPNFDDPLELTGAFTAGTGLTTNTSFFVNDEFTNGYAVTANTDIVGYNQVFDGELDLTAADLGVEYKTNVKKAIGLSGSADAGGRSAIKHPGTSPFNLYFLIAPTIDQLCTKTTAGPNSKMTAGATTNYCGVTSALASDSYFDHTVVHIIANPNALSLDTIKMKGIFIPPASGFLSLTSETWCSGTDGCGTYNDTHVTYATQQSAGALNFWQLNTNVGDNPTGTAQKYWILILTCAYQILTDMKTSTVCSTTGASDLTDYFPGVVLPQVSLVSGFKGNPLYPSTLELDFIVCFRGKSIGEGTDSQATHTFSFTNISLGLLSSSGVIHAQVYQGHLSNTTQFRIAIVLGNKFGSDTNPQTFAPILLRVGGIIASGDMNGQASNVIALFFDSSITFTDDTVSSASTTVTGSSSSFTSNIIQSQDTWSGNAGCMNYYPVMSRVTLSVGATAATDFNYYLVLQGSGFLNAKAVTLTLATTTSVSNYGSGPTYSLYGLLWQKSQKTFIAGSAVSEVGGLPTGVDFPATAVCAMTPDIIGSTVVYGGYSIKNASALMNTASCSGPVANYKGDAPLADDTQRSYGTTGWGVHFIVTQTGSKKYWDGATITSSFAHTEAPVTACYELNYGLKDADDTRKRYIIICPGDQKDGGSDTLATTDNYIKMSAFNIPIYYGNEDKDGVTTGLDTQLLSKKVLGYILTDNNGFTFSVIMQGQSINTMTTTINSSLACTVSANNATMSKANKGQRVTFTFNPKQAFDLKYGTGSDTFYVKQTITTFASQSIDETYCYTSNALLDCQMTTSSGVQKFTLTASSLTTAQPTLSISAGDISIFYWSSDTHADTDTTYTDTHTASIYLFNPDVAESGLFLLFSDCGQSTLPAWTPSAASTQVITLNTLVINQKYFNARTSFSISWSITKPFWSFSNFELDLSTYANSMTSAMNDNKRCRMYYGDVLSFDFATISSDISAPIVMTPKLLGAKAYQYTKTSFSLKCSGVTNPAATDTADLTIAQKASGQTLSTTTNADPKSQALTLVAASGSSDVTLAATLVLKKWSDAGMCTPYVFNIKNTGAGFIAAGYWVVLEFSAQAPPSLNKKGYVYCEISSNVTSQEAYCELTDDRRVKIFGSLDLTSRTDGFNFTIYCIDNPKELDSLKTIYLSIQKEDGSIIFQASPEIPEVDITASTEVAIPILDFSISKNATRSTTNFVFDLSLSSTQAVKDQQMFVSFDGEFWSNFKSGFSPSCTMVRLVTPPQVLSQSQAVDYTTDSTVSNFVNCSFAKSDKIKLYIVTTDTKNTDSSIYRLTINNVPTPWYNNEIDGQIAPPVVMLAATSATTEVVTIAAVSGCMNNTMQGFAAPTDIKLEWNSPVNAFIGIYEKEQNQEAQAELVPVLDQYNNVMSQFSEDLTFTAPTQSVFSFSTQTFSVKQGDKKLSFLIAPKASTAPGLYYLSFTPVSANNKTYAPMKPLQVLAKSSQCTINVLSEYTFPAAQGATATSGQSLPYVIDLSSCLPEATVTLKIAAQLKNGSSEDNGKLYNGYISSYGYAVINQSFVGVNFTFSDDSTLFSKPIVAGGDTGFVFQLKGVSTFSLDENEASREMGKLLFVWDNTTTNYKSYAQIQAGSNGFSTVKAVAAPTSPSVITVTNLDTPDKVGGSITYKVKCDQPAVMYWIASRLNATVESATFASIKSNTLSKNLQITQPAGKDATVMGYVLAEIKDTEKSITITPTRSNAYYKFSVFCINALETSNDTSKATTYVQAADNGGKPGIAKLTYKKDLTSEEQNKGCKAFASFSQVPCKRTMCPTGLDACGNKFDPYGDFTTSTTPSTPVTQPTTNTSTTTTTNTTTNTTANHTARRRVLANTTNTTTTTTTTTTAYTGNCSVGCTTCVSATNCTVCNSSLYRDFDYTCKASCSEGYITDASKNCQKEVKTVQVYSCSPDVFASTDNTVTLIKNAITNKASLLQAISAATGISSSLLTAELVDTTSIGSTPVTINGTKNATTQTSMTVSFTIGGAAGFIIAGYSTGNSSVTTFANLKLGTTTTGQLSGLFVQYSDVAKTYLYTWSQLTAGTAYKVWYGATDLDLVNGLTSPVQSIDISTAGTPPVTPTTIGSIRVATTFFALLALLFVAFIMI